ncbi:hypothetical protein PFISCL1PPCAC_27354, partial [Pristionchus fissidentatus]
LLLGVIYDGLHDLHIVDAIDGIVSSLPLLPSTSDCQDVQTSLVSISSTDAYTLRQLVLNFKNAGIDILVGPDNPEIGAIIQGLCEELSMVYVYSYTKMSWKNNEFSFGLFPSEQYMKQIDVLLNDWQWRSFAVIIEDNQSVDHLLPILNRRSSSPIVIRVRMADPDGMMDAAREVKSYCGNAMCWNSTNKAVIMMNSVSTIKFLEASLKLGMISRRNWFLATSLDNVIDHLQSFHHNSFRLSLPALETQFEWIRSTTTPTYEIYDRLYKAWKKKYSDVQHTKLSYSLAADSVILACYIHTRTNMTSQPKGEEPSEMFFRGLSGPVRFMGGEQRTDASVPIYELGTHGESLKIGTYTIERGSSTLSAHTNDMPGSHAFESLHEQQRKVLKVTTIAERPYVMEKTLPDGTIEGYEGFCIDLLDKLALHLGFEYELNIVRDAKYGRPKANSTEWDGMIGEILNGNADIAVAPITVTARRLEVVDFTDPFLQLGISMLMRTPDKKATASITSFMWPLSPRVWMFSAIGTFLTAFVITLIAVLSPRESPEQFNIKNSFWYLMCILLRAGSGFNCQSSASRIASSVWWTFSLVLIAQYTANFAAVLTVDRKSMPFNSFEELGNQTEYSFGSIYGGSTMQFFQYSRLETFKRIWERMENATPSSFVESNDQGVERVYVFLMESASLEYEVTQNCNLTRVGNIVLGSNGYSIALPKGMSRSRWREKLTRQILDFNEKGIMMMLKNNWWKSSEQTEECQSAQSTGGEEGSGGALGFENTLGLFVLLGAGLALSMIVALIEKGAFTLSVLRKEGRVTPVLR